MTNLDCKDIKALLSGLVDGELDAQARHEAERHLADCQPCRELVSQAERLNEMVALDVQRSLWPVGLPAGFEEGVLRRTVYGDAYQFAGRRWTSWLGWVAAAASLMLAASIWILDQQRGQPQPLIAQRPTERPPAAMNTAGYLRSWTSDQALSPDALGSVRMASWSTDPALREIEDELALIQPAIRSNSQTLADLSRNSDLSTDDSDTLYAAANLLEMLHHADMNSFADIDRIRRIAEYDELISRLAAVRDNLSDEDRPTVMAAESVLLRIVEGPLNLEDVRMLHDTVAKLDLHTRVQAISNRWPTPSSL